MSTEQRFYLRHERAILGTAMELMALLAWVAIGITLLRRGGLGSAAFWLASVLVVASPLVGALRAQETELLLMDEPLGSLDEERKEEILPYLVRLRDEAGIPMGYVSHHPSEMRKLATQIAMIQHGRVTAFGGGEVLPAAHAPV